MKVKLYKAKCVVKFVQILNLIPPPQVHVPTIRHGRVILSINKNTLTWNFKNAGKSLMIQQL